MYKLIRPLIFRLSPETIHHAIIRLMVILRYIPLAKSVMRAIFTRRNASLQREVLGLHFDNPIGLAAGFDKNAEAFDMLGTLGFGFIEIGTVTPLGQSGNPKPRCFRLPQDQAIINRMGFNNHGVAEAIKNLKRIRRRNPKLIVGGNIGKNTTTPNDCACGDYLKLFRAMYDHVDYFTVNVSCPNVENLTSLQSEQSTMDILEPLKKFRQGQSEYRPILLKISPDLTLEGVDTMIDVVNRCKIDGIVATNTTTSREGLSTPAAKIAEIGRGGLSGAPLTSRSCEMVRYIHQKTEGRLPIIGVGGVMSIADAEAMLEAGASLVQIYSGFIYEGPGFVKDINKALAAKQTIKPTR